MDEARAWLTLAGTRGVGASQVSDLLDRLGSVSRVFESGTSALVSAVMPAEVAARLSDCDEELLDRSLAWLDQDERNSLVTMDSRDYPALLREIPDPPILLFARGDRSQLKNFLFAIVGSRNPTPAGAENAYEFARYLSASGLSIASGMAAGVDGKAHEGALDATGNTVAVCGCGLDQVYPRRHESLAASIAENGLLLSEFNPGTPPLRENFPRRNRIISGLSLGVLVVEAGLRSGSLITARLAAEQGREVFAIPGSIHNPLARGCHTLIRNGAKLVESALDVIDELGPLAGVAARGGIGADAAPAPTERELDGDYERLLEACGFDPVSVDQLVERTRLTTAEVSSMLLILELQGYLQSGPGGRYTRILKKPDKKEAMK